MGEGGRRKVAYKDGSRRWPAQPWALAQCGRLRWVFLEKKNKFNQLGTNIMHLAFDGTFIDNVFLH